MRMSVVVLGSSFAGLTAALAVKHELHGDVDVTVVSPRNLFVFNPSLIWLPFGKRDRDDISFNVEPTLTEHGIDFEHHAATGLDPQARTVTLDDGRSLRYDYLVIGTGYRNNLDVVPGFRENTRTITALPAAEETGCLLYTSDAADDIL